jgi:maltooligosyltrehalose trehalohydrolase
MSPTLRDGQAAPTEEGAEAGMPPQVIAAVAPGDEPQVPHSGPPSHPVWRLQRGARLTAAGATFSVWAPVAIEIVLVIEDAAGMSEHAMAPSSSGRNVWEVRVDGVKAGTRYGYRVNGGTIVPDPVSRLQPDGVHGMSCVVDPASFRWTDEPWKGLSLADFVIYELHVGTFTEEGTFEAAIRRLPDLLALGVTAIELMPVAEFPGARNWGYDGAQLYAPHHAYGGPDGLKRLVNAAHGHGIAVVLDVVYNHVGPEGNYLDQFGPYFTEVYRTPWGRAVNYDGPGSDEVRRWAHDNALYWITEFHIDALRLDAVQEIFDFGALSFLEELSDEAHEVGRLLGRKVQLMAESDLNDPRLIRSPSEGGFGVDAQWADDFHHTLHSTLTGERQGYYQDFHDIARMADVYREPFFYARRYAPHRDRTHGRSSAEVPRQRFIVSAQNHDQVGNRAGGDRMASLVDANRQRLSAALVLLSPYVPLLFMGEEYGETAPFLYFVEHGDPALVDAVRDGRKREFAAIDQTNAPSDPQAEDTFARSKLDWATRDTPEGAHLLGLYRDLLALRREEPALRPGASDVYEQDGGDWLTVLRIMPVQNDIYDHMRSRRALLCAFNLSGRTQRIPILSDAIGDWRLRLSTDAIGYGGLGEATEHIAPIIPDRPVTDAPKRLLDVTPPDRIVDRSIVLAPWSACVYVREFPQDPDMGGVYPARSVGAPAGQAGPGDIRGEA